MDIFQAGNVPKIMYAFLKEHIATAPMKLALYRHKMFRPYHF